VAVLVLRRLMATIAPHSILQIKKVLDDAEEGSK
jgi:hypothetical protein